MDIGTDIFITDDLWNIGLPDALAYAVIHSGEDGSSELVLE